MQNCIDGVVQFRYMGVSPNTKNVTVHGVNDPQKLTDPEGSIDVQWIQGIGEGVATTYWATPGGKPGGEPFLAWTVEMANTTDGVLICWS